MRFIFAILMLLSSGAYAQNAWISVAPDHLNLFYGEGESAKFLVSALNEPTKPAYKLVVTVEYLGQTREVALTRGVGVYTTSALPLGVHSFRFVTRLVGPTVPPDPPFDQVVQDEILDLRVGI